MGCSYNRTREKWPAACGHWLSSGSWNTRGSDHQYFQLHADNLAFATRHNLSPSTIILEVGVEIYQTNR